MDAICGYRQPTSNPNRRGPATRRASKRSRDAADDSLRSESGRRGAAATERAREGGGGEVVAASRGAEVVADRGGRQPLAEERRWVAEGRSPHVEETDEAQLRPLLAKEMEKPRLRSPLRGGRRSREERREAELARRRGGGEGRVGDGGAAMGRGGGGVWSWRSAGGRGGGGRCEQRWRMQRQVDAVCSIQVG